MKKIIIVLFFISVIYIVSNKNSVIIPNDAIRFRIIANSNSLKDQTLKNKIKEDIINNVFAYITYDEQTNANKLISDSIPLIDNLLSNYNINYDINYGKNYFPKKTYKGIVYPSGYYDSLVITLDSGLGDNYWCVLYPPLCLVKEDEKTTNIEYKTIIGELINNYKSVK